MSPSWIRMAALGALSSVVACASQPPSEEQRVWLAAAKHVLANEAAGTKTGGPLLVFASTSFPKLPKAMAQLKEASKQAFCDVPGSEAEWIVERLEQVNSKAVALRESFAGMPQFRIAKKRPNKGDYLGLSRVLFSADRQTAYLNLDIGGVSGSIVRMKLFNGEWGKLEECAQWTAY